MNTFLNRQLFSDIAIFLGMCLVLLFSGVAAAAAPTFISAPTISAAPLVGNTICICASAVDPQGLPLTITYNYGDGTSDTLGKHVYMAAGVYPVTVTVSNGVASATSTFAVTITEFANLWIKKQTIKVGAGGKESWQAQYIYNADRTLANIFNPATGNFVASLGTIPIIQVLTSNGNGAQKFAGSKPKFTFKSAKGAKPSISVVLDESNQTITINAKFETFADKVPGIFHNTVQLGANTFIVEQAFDAKGKFTATSGYRSTAFVVAGASVRIGKPGKPGKPGKDSAMFSMLLGDPAFAFPGASGAKTVHVRVTNVLNQTVIDKDLTKSIVLKAGKLTSGRDTTIPAGKFSYASKTGKMTFGLSKATLTGLLTTSEEHVRVDVTLGDQTYTTRVTLFAAKAGMYSTKLPKKFASFIPGKTADTTAPAVLSTSPANLAADVADGTPISATFSKPMDPATITAATFILQQGTTFISGTVAYTGNTATFTPSSTLTPSATYIAMLTTGATDLAGNALGCCNYVWTFTMEPLPTVISTVPANKDTGVAINSKISAAFSEAMDPSSINTTTFTLVQTVSGTSTNGNVTYSGTTAVFTPQTNLPPNTSFTATITTGAKDPSGNALASIFIWSFTTGAIPDTTPPTVISTAPANAATGVAPNSAISATFSKAMDPSTISAGTFTLMQGTTAVSGVVTYAATGSTATFTPSSNLAASTVFTATVTTGVKDLAGNALASNFVWSFTTGAAADTTRPTVTSTVPANSATGVATNSAISATFSKAMNPSTINTTTFTLMQGTTPVSGAATYAAVGDTATFTPSSNLAPNTLFTATVTTGVQDLAGNAMASSFVWSFTSGAAPDTTPPTVVSTNPINNATGVAINQTVNATFSKAMDPSTINTSNITLAGPGPNPIAGTVAYDAVNKIATFTPGSNLAPSTQFTATVTTGVKDLSGNALANNFVWTFTTGAQQAIKPVALGAMAPYGTFGGGSGMTNQGIFTVVNGDIGTTGASTTVTGFHDTAGDIYTETPLNVGQVNGNIDTAPPTPGGAGVGGNATTFAIATQAASDANTAFINLSPAKMPGGTDPGAGHLGGLTLPPGIYQSNSGTFDIIGSDLTLDAKGDSNAVWVFQMASSLTVGGPGAAFPQSVILINGAQAKNIFWQVGSAATINAGGGGTMVGTIIASAGVTFSTAGNVTLTTLNGRAIGLNASTTLVNTIINVPAP